MFYVSVDRSGDGDDLPRDFNDFEVAAGESSAAYRDGKLWGFIRHARISEEQASEFWARMAELVAEFDKLPRAGETMYGFAVGIYPTDHPTLPDPSDSEPAAAGLRVRGVTSVGSRCRRGCRSPQPIRSATRRDLPRALAQLIAAARQVGGLGGVARQLDGPVVRRTRLLTAAQPAQQ